MAEEQNLKVSDLPEQEQKELLQEAYAVGLKGVFTGWKVETLKQKIEEAKNKEQETEAVENSVTVSADEKETKDVPQESEEQKAQETGAVENSVTVSADEKEAKDVPQEGEEQKVQETQTELSNEQNSTTVKEIEPEEMPTKQVSSGEEKPKNKGRNGICHICGSRVENGVCTGCRFIR